MRAEARTWEGAEEVAPAEGAPPVDDRPRSVYEMITRQMLQELREDVAEVKGRVNTLLWMVAGAILLDLLARLVR